MVKNYFLKMFAGIAFLGLLTACNTTSDPTESVPNPDSGPPPKKVLAKVTANNVSQEEYVTTAGTGDLQTAVFKDESTSSSAYYTGTVSYTNKNITKIKFVSSATSSLAYEFNIVPDDTGKKIYNATSTATGATPSVSVVSDYAFTYDSVTSKLTKILEKRKEGGISAYNSFIDYSFVYNGNNVIQVVCSKGILDINGNPNMTTATVSKYSFQNYDAQKSPYSTLPSVYFIARSLITPINFYKISPNNPTSMFIELPSPAAPVNTAQSYSYDNQGYVVVEKNKNVTFTYKNL
ncbi:hypothetical protein [Chryseobacterium viscerum]|uniref:DUF4595 domain-containing protein n=1 Tax=Chryseobacterium viscerum TaxID=1037377 RepID=A0A316WVW4_9FLAO|nr:hypothetical protein [Chryseobacterium viscerum]PWN65387.1 hypothetical protein C1634_001190 [Chryseobacterium viscerum]